MRITNWTKNAKISKMKVKSYTDCTILITSSTHDSSDQLSAQNSLKINIKLQCPTEVMKYQSYEMTKVMN